MPVPFADHSSHTDAYYVLRLLLAYCRQTESEDVKNLLTLGVVTHQTYS